MQVGGAMVKIPPENEIINGPFPLSIPYSFWIGLFLMNCLLPWVQPSMVNACVGFGAKFRHHGHGGG